ncbi:hypothetical protein [Nocardia sp. NPDC051981]|uniref:hypothetical protein n=1 Tax=Nocardia sp. NPDC051981 TaxID=3155417 RepID=UPI00341673F7
MAVTSIVGFGVTVAVAGTGPALSAVTVLDHDGVYAVPSDIAPGQYMTYHANDDCVFTVADAAGNVLFSGGIGAAIRGSGGQIQIGIGSNAATFSTTSCGVWRLVDGGGPATGPSTGSSGLGF